MRCESSQQRPVGAAAALYSSVFCGQQNGGHVNRGVCLLVVERKGEWSGEEVGGGFWGVWCGE